MKILTLLPILFLIGCASTNYIPAEGAKKADVSAYQTGNLELQNSSFAFRKCVEEKRAAEVASIRAQNLGETVVQRQFGEAADLDFMEVCKPFFEEGEDY